jgi:hypothetical protein
MELGSKATVDWYLWVLTRGKLLTELRLGKGRYVVDVRKPSTEL